MDVGLYFDLRNPQGKSGGWARTYGFVLEMCQEAERLGISSVWFTEHHGFDDGYLPQPLVFAAAVAARTSKLRLGTAILIAPFRDPLHIAEEAAVVDLVSEGRLELGIGAGYRHAEFEMFGVDRSSRLDSTTRAASELRRMWRDSQVTPDPHQDPVPLWLGFSGPRGAARAGRLGEGLLSVDPSLLAPYREGLISS
ncbi:LLM class flavin-dependent oxidoreductase [Rhodococcus sp. IEGM 1366]|uniref:LLM class flavin-dependent oxidoreductase n=1 Tax=Rhodococcus sp. IEGM 1366 TaxID=3082223 RepID=UPI002954CD3A|nr:LLM class flavin-dependent oxidoreductase [Rhodococcus sp. IEGM 1366]MDV8070845.1 LLM class flavin-dependent oxidoreductase [Rhodococcus sp. IEGM 1366]